MTRMKYPFAFEAYISLGSNLGKRDSYLYEAITLLKNDSQIHDILCSPIYETLPVGYTSQPKFLNMVVRIYTTYSSLHLLHVLQEIERILGRERSVHWGPRTIDLDLLMYENEQVNTKELQLPHPRMHERAFVMIPLKDIYEKEKHPLLGNIQKVIDHLEDKKGVEIWKSTI